METTPIQKRVTGLIPVLSEGDYHISVPSLTTPQGNPMQIIETCWRYLKRKVAHSAAARYKMGEEEGRDATIFYVEFDASAWTGR